MTRISLSLLETLDRALSRFEIGVAGLALALTLLVALFTVGARTANVATSEWVLELPMELLVVAAIFASGALIRAERHLRVDFMVTRLPDGWRRRITRGGEVALAAFSVFLAERALTAARGAQNAGLRLPELFDLPVAAPLLVAAVGFLFWALHFLAASFRE